MSRPQIDDTPIAGLWRVHCLRGALSNVAVDFGAGFDGVAA